MFRVEHRHPSGPVSIMNDGNGASHWPIKEQAQRQGLQFIRYGARACELYLVEIDDGGEVVAEWPFEE